MNYYEPFNMNRFIDTLSNNKSLSKDQLDKLMLKTMKNPEFMDHLFPTGKDAPADGLTEKMYSLLVKKKVLKSICRVIESEGPKTFNRSIATWLYSIATVAITLQEDRWNEYRKRYGNLDPKRDMAMASDARQDRETLEEYDKITIYLVKLIRKMEKRNIKKLIKEANVPDGLAECVVVTVPDHKYINNFRVGFYLNQVLLSTYRYVDEHKFDTKYVNWKEFFKILFGENNVIEAATFILLEGVHRIDNYGRDVEHTFNDLTMFALKELEKAPETLKNQMIELYVKRISRMFANKTFDLRANLLDIDPNQFPKLVETVGHYAKQIAEIVNKGLKPKSE